MKRGKVKVTEELLLSVFGLDKTGHRITSISREDDDQNYHTFTVHASGPAFEDVPEATLSPLYQIFVLEHGMPYKTKLQRVEA
jgi:hypothetical protein